MKSNFIKDAILIKGNKRIHKVHIIYSVIKIGISKYKVYLNLA